MLKRFLLLLLVLCMPFQAQGDDFSVVEEEGPLDRATGVAQYLMSRMTLEEMAAQLFIVTPEDLAGVSPANDAEAFLKMNITVGGVVLFGQNMRDEESLSGMVEALKAAGSLIPPFIAVYDSQFTPSPMASRMGYTDGDTIERFRHFGFDMVFAPSLDITTAGGNTEIDAFSYGNSAAEVIAGAFPFARALRQAGIVPVFGHFPGIGNAVSVNTYRGRGRIEETFDEMRYTSLRPFQRAAAFHGGVIQVTNLSLRQVEKDMPACLSAATVGVLREEMGYEGIIMTDSLRSPAVTGAVKNSQAGVAALEAGCDMLLLPANYAAALRGVVDAVQEGRLSQERLEESVLRVLTLKCAYEQQVAWE